MNFKQFLNLGQYLENEVRQLAAKGSKHWFDPDSMKFFSSRISGLMWKTSEYIYFVSSEADRTSAYYHKGVNRAYSIRQINRSSGDIETIGKFQEYDTLYEARKGIKEILEK